MSRACCQAPRAVVTFIVRRLLAAEPVSTPWVTYPGLLLGDLSQP